VKLEASVQGQTRPLHVETTGGRTQFTWGDAAGEFEAHEVEPGVYSVVTQGRSITVTVGANGWIAAEGEMLEVTLIDPRDAAPGRGAQGRAGQVKIAAPMPGRVVRVLVSPGQTVTAGEGLIVVEAMKMQNEMKAPRDATVAAVKTQDGATVAAGDVLLVLE